MFHENRVKCQRPNNYLKQKNLDTIDEGLELECTDSPSQSVLKSPPHDSKNESIYELNDTDPPSQSVLKFPPHDSENESIDELNDRGEIQLMIPGFPLQLQSPVADSLSGSISDDSVMARAREYLTQKSNDSDSSVDRSVFKSVSFFIGLLF